MLSPLRLPSTAPACLLAPQGYFKLAAKAKDPRGTCGVLTTASYPLKKGTTNPEVRRRLLRSGARGACAWWRPAGQLAAPRAPHRYSLCCWIAKRRGRPILLTSPSFLPQVPSFCGWFGWTECPARSACVCNFDLFGLLCLNWGCQAA